MIRDIWASLASGPVDITSFHGRSFSIQSGSPGRASNQRNTPVAGTTADYRRNRIFF
jgi:hypothetical protein